MLNGIVLSTIMSVVEITSESGRHEMVRGIVWQEAYFVADIKKGTRRLLFLKRPTNYLV